jgi:NAD(P)-dependent dehydrogenase (short-subunit alcohol dehydrogenase family)
MTVGLGASLPAEDGTKSIKHLLFGELAGNGWYYGSDGVRSPLHFMRNPGEPAYDGAVPDFATRVLVTGGNTGIGFALCRQLAAEHGCHVYLGSRSLDKGRAAVQAILGSHPNARCELVQIDTGSDESVSSAAAAVKALLKGDTLYGVVNNAGCGLAHGVDAEAMVNVNLFGPKRVSEAFIPLLSPALGRVVNIGSGAGPMYVRSCGPAAKQQLCKEDQTWEEIEAHLKSVDPKSTPMSGYGLSKALLANYTSYLAKVNPNLKVNCCSPGFIDTAIVKGMGASKTPEEGTVAAKHLLFGELAGNGWYYGSDGVRSPLHFMRNPGEPAYDGVVPQF